MKAIVRKEYKLRLIIIGAMCLVWAGWCVRDAVWVYPDQTKAYNRFMELSRSGVDNWEQTWNEEATANHWATTPTKRATKDIPTQWVMFWITLPVGFYFAIATIRSMGQYVEMEDETLSTHAVKNVRFDQIKELDKRLWEKKGIAFVVYEGGDGKTGRIKLDDWIYERQKIRDMVKKLDEYLNPGGESEEENSEPAVDVESGE